MTLHWEFGPHGEGMQGFVSFLGGGGTEMKRNIEQNS